MISGNSGMNSISSLETYRNCLMRPTGVDPPSKWQPSENLWCASLSGCSTSSADSAISDSPPHEAVVPVFNNMIATTLEGTMIEKEAAPTKKIRNVRKSDKYHCVVCGDKPTGYHYDVLSCNGCKTFFRRTIISKREFKCTKGGTCQFNKDFRCACRACRFQKCLKMGMNRNGIQFPASQVACSSGSFSGDEGVWGEEAPDEDLTVGHVADNHNTNTTVSVMPDMFNDEDYKHMRILDTILYREQSTKLLRRADCPIVPEGSLKNILREPCLIGRRSFDVKDFLIRQKKEYEKNPLKFWMVADLYLAVEFAKTFNVFRSLPEHDQQCLLSHVAGIMQIASQAFYTAELQSESLTFPDGLNALQLRMKEDPEQEQYYRDLYCRPIDMIRDLQLSPEEFVLFKTLALFSANSVDLTPEGRKIVEETREKLAHTLRKQFVKEYGLARGTEKLARTLLSLSSFLAMSEKRRNYLEVCDLLSKINLSTLAKSVFLKRFDL